MLMFLMPQKNSYSTMHIITDVALHLGVFQDFINFLGEALWLKCIKVSNYKLY
jgi:hypothetical protein